MTSHKRSIFSGIAGHALEYYDIMLYGFFAASISPLFFPTEDPIAGRLFSVTTFAMGFVMRPVGSIFFGHLGDKLGRKKALLLSVFLVSFPTFLIGLLPVYAQIGLAAPVILILCRLLQGFCLGGEVGGAITFVLEHTPRSKSGFISSVVEVFCYIGAFIGTSVGFLCTLSFMPEWGWRIPFILGGVFGLIIYRMRTKMEETSAFLEVEKEHTVSRLPFKDLVTKQYTKILLAVGICMGFIVPFYMITTYTNEILRGDLGLPTSQILALNSGLMLLWICWLPLMGKLSDRVGIYKLMTLASSVLIFISFPLFQFAIGTSSPELWKIIVMQVTFSLIVTGFSAPFCSIFAYLFPSQQRYSGSGFSYALGAALFGGFTPLFSVKLVTWTGDPASPGYLLVLSSIVGLVCARYARKLEIPDEENVSSSTPLDQPAQAAA